MTDLMLSGAVQARHNWNRWVADCMTCRSALTVPPGTEFAGCWDCGGTIGPICWPNDPAGIEAILSYRPDPNTRSWEPGETLEDLLAENFTHGCVPPEWDELCAASGGQLVVLDVADQFVTGGLVMERRALLAGRHPEHMIGA